MGRRASRDSVAMAPVRALETDAGVSEAHRFGKSQARAKTTVSRTRRGTWPEGSDPPFAGTCAVPTTCSAP